MGKKALRPEGGMTFLSKVKADKKKAALKKSKGDDEDYIHEDEIDQFMKQRNKVTLDEDDVEGSDSDDQEEVFGLDVADSDDDDDEQDDEDDEALSNQWGKKKKNYYSTDFVEEELSEEEEEEAAKEEEEEVKRLQKKQAEVFQDEDFDDAPLGVKAKLNVEKTKKTPKKGDAGILDTFNKDLDQISFDFEAGEMEVERVSKNVSTLSDREKLNIITSESPELLEFLEDFKNKIIEARDKVQPILQKVKNGELPTNKGVSYLEVKSHLMLSYCTDICYYLLLKAQGKSVRDHPVIDQLVRIRTIMEKTKPLDQKLKNQIDKLIKVAVTGATDGVNDPRSFKPNPTALLEEAEEEEEEAETDGIYRPPKLAEMHFDETSAASARKKQERLLKKASNSAIMKEISREFSDKPEETPQIGAVEKDDDSMDRDIERYEEDMYLRVQLSKKEMQKQKKKSQKKQDDLDTFADFGDLAALDGEEAEERGSILQKKSMKQVLSQLGKKKANGRAGDADLPYRDAEDGSRKRRRRDEDFGGEDERPARRNNFEADEDDFYKETARASQAKKQAKKDAAVLASESRRKPAVTDIEEGEKRGISNAISSNRGLTRSRNKDTKHARTKLRSKYEKAVQRRKGAVRGPADTSKPYGGESTGIKPNITRSVSLKP